MTLAEQYPIGSILIHQIPGGSGIYLVEVVAHRHGFLVINDLGGNGKWVITNPDAVKLAEQ